MTPLSTLKNFKTLVFDQRTTLEQLAMLLAKRGNAAAGFSQPPKPGESIAPDWSILLTVLDSHDAARRGTRRRPFLSHFVSGLEDIASTIYTVRYLLY